MFSQLASYMCLSLTYLHHYTCANCGNQITQEVATLSFVKPDLWQRAKGKRLHSASRHFMYYCISYFNH